jgi:hypothetical protein
MPSNTENPVFDLMGLGAFLPHPTSPEPQEIDSKRREPPSDREEGEITEEGEIAEGSGKASYKKQKVLPPNNWVYISSLCLL